MSEERLRQYIGQISPVLTEDLALLVNSAHRKDLKKGESLLTEGQICQCYYLVDTGYLRTFYNKDGIPVNPHFTFAGSFITDLKSIKEQSPSECTIEAGEKTAVWIFQRHTLSALCNVSAEIMLFSRRLLSRLLIASDEHSNLFKISTPSERYAYIQKNNPRLLERISLSQLASYLGITREALHRIRRQKG